MERLAANSKLCSKIIKPCLWLTLKLGTRKEFNDVIYCNRATLILYCNRVTAVEWNVLGWHRSVEVGEVDKHELGMSPSHDLMHSKTGGKPRYKTPRVSFTSRHRRVSKFALTLFAYKSARYTSILYSICMKSVFHICQYCLIQSTLTSLRSHVRTINNVGWSFISLKHLEHASSSQVRTMTSDIPTSVYYSLVSLLDREVSPSSDSNIFPSRRWILRGYFTAVTLLLKRRCLVFYIRIRRCIQQIRSWSATM